MQSFSDYVSDELTPVDGETRFADSLDSHYSFDCVGEPFASMSPSEVLKNMDPTAFRCGCNDYLDGDEFRYYAGEYYDSYEFDEAVGEYRDELETAIAELEEDIEEEESAETASYSIAVMRTKLAELQGYLKEIDSL